MNLLCPNCQKMLTVPEQYAGQLMKCPLCSGTFTVPGLPAAPPAAALPPPAETYGVHPETPPSPSASPLTASPPTPPLTSTASTAPPSTITGTPPPPRPPGAPMTFSIWFKPEVVRWVAPGALILCLIFMLFFPWLGVYPGGQAAAWQYAWQIPLGFKPFVDADLQKEPMLHQQYHTITADELKEGSETNQPSFDLLMLFYWPFFLFTLAVTVACAALPLLPVKVPPALQPVMQWRWGIVAVVNLLLFLVLVLQLIWVFSWEERVSAWKMSQPEVVKLAKSDSPDTIQAKTLKALKGEAANLVERTIYVKLTVFLEIIAIAAALIMLGLERRTNSTPVHLDLVL